MTLDAGSLRLLEEAAARLDAAFDDMPAFDAGVADVDRMRGVLADVTARMHDNFPYPHPLYAGQMLKPPHAIARLAYALAMSINPNNHALDGGRASSAMEKEAVAEITSMWGWGDQHLGHLTGGGTMANLEALWVSSRLRPGARVVASAQAHYTHSRMCDVIGVDFEAVPSDERGRMDMKALEAALERGGVGTVVATLGTTGLGAVDPLPDILVLAARHDARVHVDAAYGGYYTLASTLEPHARAAFDAMAGADSVVIDPHKHGLQPYGCGCVVFRDPAVGKIYQHDSPYTYFSSGDLHLGEISLECSRPGAAAVALWATQRMFPLERGGEFARMLESCRAAALELHARVAADDRFLALVTPELDIVVFAPRAEKASEVSQRSQRVFDEAARRHLHLALIEVPAAIAAARWPDLEMDRERVRCLRSVLMKPEHGDWIDAIWKILETSEGVL